MRCTEAPNKQEASKGRLAKQKKGPFIGWIQDGFKGVSVGAPKPHSGPFSGWFGSDSGGLPGCNSDFSVRNSDFRLVTLTFRPESESFH